jgi:hypothetical protein
VISRSNWAKDKSMLRVSCPIRLRPSCEPGHPQQLLKRRPLHRSPRKTAVVIAIADELPSLVGLALDISLRGLALVVEGVEVLLETRVGGDTRVDGAAKSGLVVVSFYRWTS